MLSELPFMVIVPRVRTALPESEEKSMVLFVVRVIEVKVCAADRVAPPPMERVPPPRISVAAELTELVPETPPLPRRSDPPFSTTEVVASRLPVEPRLRAPAPLLTVVVPVNALWARSVVVPVPLCKRPPVPVIWLARVSAPVPLKPRVPLSVTVPLVASDPPVPRERIPPEMVVVPV